MTTITRFTKEQLIASAREKVKSLEFAVTQTAFAESRAELEEELELARIALASLTAEPVAWIWKTASGYDTTSVRPPRNRPGKYAARPLYAAPPAPVVPDEIRNKLKAEGLAELLKDARDYAPLTAEQWETLTNNWHQTFVGLSGEGDACRTAMLDNCATVESRNHAGCSPKNGLKCAAMLQDSQPVSNRDELPDIVGWIRSDYHSDRRMGDAPIFILGCVDPSDVWGVKYIPLSGNSPATPECSCRTCRPVTMTDMRFVVCPECGNKRCPHANDHNNACTCSNEPGQAGSAYPAAPRKEVK
ncbi:hypothetical protein [Citrobacter farmeri]|uniref:hypothetical protein n=1 Tax=Citrobacter farmeri TaxID=67824 RepID=UPI0023B012FD|nr:hypothetical protein [Citrobacter farmeri]